MSSGIRRILRRHDRVVVPAVAVGVTAILVIAGTLVLAVPKPLRPEAAARPGERHGRVQAKKTRRRVVGYRLAAAGSCPWVAESRAGTRSPSELAAEVLAKMTLEEKVSFLVAYSEPPYENVSDGVPSLCIPPLTLTDGPDGIAYGAPGVTQLPAAIGLAASFKPSVTYATGRVEGAQARAKGLDVVQGPELNLARVPESGRTFEAYGEDPDLAGAMGAANVEGIQSEGVMADAKHFTAYNQEEDRVQLNQVVSTRALAELYDAPFAAAVQRGHVASVMCSYGNLNGVNICSDPALYATLRSWGFRGFVRSDLAAVSWPQKAFRAGLDLLKPGNVGALEELVASGSIPMSEVNAAVASVLREMFAFGLIAHPRPMTIGTRAATPADTQVALRAAESSMVLLQNRGGVLPISPADRSVAVIGSDAGPAATTTGLGSSRVVPEHIVTPLQSLRATLGHRAVLTYTPADSPQLSLPPIPAADLIGTPLDQSFLSEPGYLPDCTRGGTISSADATASKPGSGRGWSSWSAVLEVPASGTYELSLGDSGNTWMGIDGRWILSSPGMHTRSEWSTTEQLDAGVPYTLTVDWFSGTCQRLPQIGLRDVTNEIDAAVNAARHASVAVVFVGETQAEGIDRSSLFLPGDADALIARVAAANPRTVVVLNTGGAVFMPWIHRVASVIEAWYPGQEDGPATAAVLDGQFDPSGHLPVTFPAPANPDPVATAAQYPGVDGTATYNEGLEIGYRWYQSNGVVPQFPFGYGLSYTSFALSVASSYWTAQGLVVDIEATNVGARTGTAVVQAYVHYPAAAGEPPEQLRAFDAIGLLPSQSRLVRLTLPMSAFEAYVNGGFRAVPGTYSIDVGQSSADLPIHLETPSPSPFGAFKT